jgi:hypothetical protein
MNTFSRHRWNTRILLSASFICALSFPAFADDGTDKRAPANAASSNAASGSAPGGNAAQPSRTREKKVYTNDDVETLRTDYGASTVGDATLDNSVASTGRPYSAPKAIVVRSAPTQPLPPDKDPLWYAQQAASVSSQIADIDDQVQQLRNFRASDSAPGPSTPGLTVGLDIYAPADGITTDAQIQQLLQQRADLDAQVADLQDRARANDIDPGVLRRAADNPQSVENVSALTPQQRLAATLDTLDSLQSELAATRDTEAAMHQEAAAYNVKLIPETKFGGGFTADYLKQLSLHQAAVQEQISTTEDTARKQGIPPNSLP